MKLVLASQSPRRKELLTLAGYQFTVVTADIDESQLPDEDPIDYTTRLAVSKAQAVFERLGKPDDTVVLGADTTVAIDDLLLGKPSSAAEAHRMLLLLQGRAHAVTTGIALLCAARTLTHAETTSVFFSPMTTAEIDQYIATGEPMDKAGAYGIQGHALRWIPRIEGDYSNVVGLPLAATSQRLRIFGIDR